MDHSSGAPSNVVPGNHGAFGEDVQAAYLGLETLSAAKIKRMTNPILKGICQLCAADEDGIGNMSIPHKILKKDLVKKVLNWVRMV